MAITDSLQPSGFGLDPMAMGQWPNTPLQIQQMAASPAIDTAKQRQTTKDEELQNKGI